MTGLKIFLPAVIIFFLMLGLYLKYTEKKVDGIYLDADSGWQHTAMSGNFVLFLSAIFLIAFLYALQRNKK